MNKVIDDVSEILDDLTLKNRIEIILRQTNMTYDEAKEKMCENKNDHVLVIKNWLGIKNKYSGRINVNQEIFKQFRKKLYITS